MHPISLLRSLLADFSLFKQTIILRYRQFETSYCSRNVASACWRLLGTVPKIIRKPE
jgi:hypothetical protein